MATIKDTIKQSIISKAECNETLVSGQLVDIYLEHYPKAKRHSAIESVSSIALELDRAGRVFAEFDKSGRISKIKKRVKN